MMPVSPSAVVTHALGLASSGEDVCGAEQLGECCAVCGIPLVAGEPIDRLVLASSFTNHNDLADPAGRWRCGDCTTVMTESEFQMSLATVCVSARGAVRIMTKQSRAWAFLEPPEPPFVIAIQNAKQQHVLWRAPVNYTREILLVRLGERIFRLRRRALVAARDACFALEEARARGIPGWKPEKKDEVDSPFFTDWKGKGAVTGQLKPWYWSLHTSGAVPAALHDILVGLSAHEAWALAAVLHRDPQPAQFIQSLPT